MHAKGNVECQDDPFVGQRFAQSAKRIGKIGNAKSQKNIWALQMFGFLRFLCVCDNVVIDERLANFT